MPVPGGNLVLPQPDLSRTAVSTPFIRLANTAGSTPPPQGPPPRPGPGAPVASGGGGGGTTGGADRRSSRNCSGSLPAACASSSMNDCMTNETAHAVGARIAPVGTPDAITDWNKLKFGTNRAGNSLPPPLDEPVGPTK